MIIRNSTLNDFESLKLIKPSIGLETVTDRLDRQSKGEVDFLVLEDNGELVSFGLLKWQGKDTHPEYPDMEDLYTIEDKRGMGYGSLLIKECEKRVKEKGFSKIGLAVNPEENDYARQLYHHLGYRPTGEKSYVDGVYNGVEDWCIDMEKILVPLTLSQVSIHPEILTFELTLKSGLKALLRPLTSTDTQPLADFLSRLSPPTRRFYTFDSYDLNMASKLCDAIAKYDKLRFIVETSDGRVIGLFEYSFDITSDDLNRYRGYGVTLNQGTDCRFGPCLSDEYQNQGLGSIVFPYILQIAKNFGQKRVYLWGGVFADNAQALHYYQKNGFIKAGYFINNNNIPCVDMILEVD